MQLTLETAPITKAILNSSVVIIDTETSSLSPWVDKQILAGVGVKTLDGESFYLPFRHTFDVGSDNANIEELHKLGEALKPYTIVCHNAKFDLAVLWQEGVDLTNGTVLDTIVLMRLISEDEPNYKLKTLAKKYLDPNALEYERALKKLMKENSWETYDLVPAKEILDYVEHDLIYAEGLYKLAMPVIKERELVDLLDDERKATRALFHMEREGFTSNKGWVKRSKSKIEKQSNVLKLECYSNIGKALVKRGKSWEELSAEEKENWTTAWGLYSSYSLNIQSTQQLGKIFHGLGIQSPKKIKTGESWDKYVLADLAKEYPLADLSVRYRTISGIADYYDDFLERMDSNDVIHCSIKQAGAKSGRYSATQPNLQNIPSPSSPAALDLSEEERELLFEVRGAFIPREDNFLLLADWSGQELRILADYSSEEELIRAFELGLDVHKLAAHAALGEMPTNEVEAKWWRNKGKEINFGIIYGIGSANLAKRMKCTKEEAEKFKGRYFSRYPKVKKFIEQVYNTVEKRLTVGCKVHGSFCVDWCDSEKLRRGWIKNIWGRRRYLTQNESYKGVNYLIQGTAADLMRSTNWKLYENLKEHETMIAIPIHDEFIFDMPYTEAREVIPIIINTMETCDKLKVPLKVDLKWAPVRWSESFSLSCDECNGNGKIFSLTEDERFDTLVKNDWDTLNSLTSEPCVSCAGSGFDLRKIKGIKR